MAISAGSLASSLATNLTGSTKKAILLVRQQNSAASSSVPGAGGDKAVKAGAGLALTGGAASLASGAGSLTNYQLSVQYNPSSISFRAGAQPIPFQYLQQNLDPSIPAQNTKPPSITMSVRLIFDQMNVKDCFMLEKFKVSTQDVAQLAVNKGVNTKVYSVRTVTNAFLGMLMSETTRNVTFQWADTSFSGEVTEARAIYTMFSISGRPVRSEVTINISQRLENDKDGDVWDQAFEKCFSATGQAVAGGKSAGEMVTNLVNISI